MLISFGSYLQVITIETEWKVVYDCKRVNTINVDSIVVLNRYI